MLIQERLRGAEGNSALEEATTAMLSLAETGTTVLVSCTLL